MASSKETDYSIPKLDNVSLEEIPKVAAIPEPSPFELEVASPDTTQNEQQARQLKKLQRKKLSLK